MSLNPITSTMGSQGQTATSWQDGASINNVLPKEIIRKILAKLPPSADSTAVQVCTLWNNIVQIHQPLRVFGEEIWSEYLNFEVEGNVPPLPKGICKTTRFDRQSFAGKKAAPFCTAILIPKGLTPSKLIELMKNPKKGYSTKLDYIWYRIVAELGDKAIEESYWFVMTNDVIEGSRSKSYEDQKELVKKKTNAECDLPTYLEALVCCVMHHVIYGEHLLGRERCTFTRCQEWVDGYPIVVGDSGGLRVCSVRFDCDYDGVVACRKFC